MDMRAWEYSLSIDSSSSCSAFLVWFWMGVWRVGLDLLALSCILIVSDVLLYGIS